MRPSATPPLRRVRLSSADNPINRFTWTPTRHARAGIAASRHSASMETSDMSDFQITDQGSIFLIRPLNEAARQWLDENVVTEAWQCVQGALCAEARFARDLVIEITEAGFEISR